MPGKRTPTANETAIAQNMNDPVAAARMRATATIALDGLYLIAKKAGIDYG